MMQGILNLDKPGGCTSRSVVDAVVRLAGRKARVGHAGTLDPMASGVLVVCLGRATRLVPYIQAMTKTYRARVRLGARSDTDDAEGQITPSLPSTPPERELVATALARQVGLIAQVPPRYAAVKVKGQRAYDLARDGKEFELKSRAVRIDGIDLIDYAWPDVQIVVQCGGGTYIRAIARDLGEALGCGGLLTELVRTAIGGFVLADALSLDELATRGVAAAVLPLERGVCELPRATLDESQTQRVRRGQSIESSVAACAEGVELALFDPDQKLIAIGRAAGGESGLIQPRVVLDPL